MLSGYRKFGQCDKWYSLASLKPPDGSEPEKHGDEENEMESRGGIQAKVAVATLKGDKTLAELAEHFGKHPTQITEWKQHLLAGAADVLRARRPSRTSLISRASTPRSGH
jgi:hypothetical protein